MFDVSIVKYVAEDHYRLVWISQKVFGMSLKDSARENELCDILRGLSVAKLKLLCGDFKLKVSGNKIELIVRLVESWKDQTVSIWKAQQQPLNQ
jgi:hypothetical protein